jgi:hypothetical protein
MKLTGIIKRFENKNFVVKLREGTATNWVVKNPSTGAVLQFYENGKGSGEVGYFTARHPETDASVDLFLDSYYHSVKSAIEHLERTP